MPATRFQNARLMTAMVTPFDSNNRVDEKAAEKLIHHLLQNNSEGIVLAGTTGEGSALSTDEKLHLLKLAQKHTQQKVPLVVATGSNNTEHTIELSKKAANAGADGLLVVSPYYVRPSQEGLYQHFKAVAQAVGQTPIILYNIPGRTGVMIHPETMAKLSQDCTNIIGVKQSYADMDALSDIKTQCSDDFLVWSGDDSLTLPMMSLGAIGVISVASHLMGASLFELIEAVANGDLYTAQAFHQRMYPSFKALFAYPNPMVVKAALAELKLIQNNLKLPLVNLNSTEFEPIRLILERGQYSALSV